MTANAKTTVDPVEVQQQPYVVAHSSPNLSSQTLETAPQRMNSPEVRLVLAMVEEAGFDPLIARRIIEAESGGNTHAIGDSGESLGLWQIHQPAHPIGEECSFDPVCSTVYAIKLLRSDRSWNHWTAYRNLY